MAILFTRLYNAFYKQYTKINLILHKTFVKSGFVYGPVLHMWCRLPHGLTGSKCHPSQSHPVTWGSRTGPAVLEKGEWKCPGPLTFLLRAVAAGVRQRWAWRDLALPHVAIGLFSKALWFLAISPGLSPPLTWWCHGSDSQVVFWKQWSHGSIHFSEFQCNKESCAQGEDIHTCMQWEGLLGQLNCSVRYYNGDTCHYIFVQGPRMYNIKSEP